ncbi:MAG: TonB-dependent receptor domain-containing protein [Sphingomonadaceae bacterium]
MKKKSTFFASAAPLALGIVLMTAPAAAQVSDPPGEGLQDVEEDAEPGEAAIVLCVDEPNDPNCVRQGTQIIVTGTRIASPTIDTASPVQILDSEDIDTSGAVNVQELLLENPSVGIPALSRTNSAFLTSATGIATIDLRDLGSDRTLVLINGRRVVAGVPGSSIVDLNTIPTQFIERIDILTGGASSLYGSDAVAGVVNFIYRSDFEGLEIDSRFGISERGDNGLIDLSLTMGTNIFDDRGNIMIHVGYSDQDNVPSVNRSNLALDDLSLFRLTGDPADFGTPFEPFFSSFPPQGRFSAGGFTFTFSPSGSLQPCFTTNGATCSSALGSGVGPNGFNRQRFRTLAVPVERKLLAARAFYDVTDDITIFAEGTYTSSFSAREIEPFPLGSDALFPATGGAVPIEGPQGRNPFVPDPIYNAATDTDGDGFRDIGFARRLLEFGTRSGQVDRDFYRYVVGVEGELFDEKFRWDINYNRGQTNESQSSSGQVNVPNFREALNAMVDVNDVDNDGDTTDAVCVDADARAEGCVPLDIYGFGSISQDAVDYIAAGGTTLSRVTQDVVQANLSGELFDLPGGPLGIALGGEYRKETSLQDLDALTNTGQNAGNALPDTEGEFDVWEGYLELNIPLLADIPFFHALTLSGAARVADYSTVGTVYSYSAGAEWAPIQAIKFRGTYARAVRAPNIGELFTGPSQTFPPGLSDPCAGIGASGGGALGDRCRAEPGVARNIAANGVFTLNQADIQGISGFNSGNPDLEEETADTFTAGVVVAPRSGFFRDFSLTVDYFNIVIDDAIVPPPRQFILDQCYREGVQEFCDLITRRPTATAINSAGSLEFVDAPLFNSGGLETEGIDVVLNYGRNFDFFGLAPDGRIDFRIAYTHYFEGFVQPTPDAEIDPFVGEIGNPEDRFTARLGLSNEQWGISFTGTYIGEAFEDNQFLAAFGLEPDAIRISPEFYLDTQIRFTPSESYEFFFGVDNVLDNDAPNILSGTTFNVTGTDTAADVYDPFGRRFYAGARLRF